MDMKNCFTDVLQDLDAWVACAECGAESLITELKCGHRHERRVQVYNALSHITHISGIH